MANDGSIKIGVEIDSSDAVSGLNKISGAMADTSDEVKDLGKDAQVGLGKVDTAADQAAAGLDHLAAEAQQTGSSVNASLNQATSAAGDTVVGLDGLKDTSGEAASSMSALAGAVSIVSPEMGAALAGASALAGGMEGAAKATALFGGSLKSMMLTLGPIAVAIGAAAAAYHIFTKNAEEAKAALDAFAEGTASVNDVMRVHDSMLRELSVELGVLSQAEADRADILARQAADQSDRINERLELMRSEEGMTQAQSEAHTRVTAAIRQANAVELELFDTRQANIVLAEEEAAAEIARTEAILARQQRQAAGLAEILAFKEADAALADKAAGAETAARLQEEAEALDEVAAATRRAAEADAKLAAAAELAADRQAELDSIMNASIGAMGGFFDLAGTMAGDNAEDQKALALVQTTINGLVAGIKAFADLGPVAGGIAAAGIAASTAAALAQISSQPVPTMHSGGLVGGIGDTPINAQGGEAVLNREAVAGLGAEGVNALNSGGGVGGTVVVEMTYKQRVFDRVVIDNLRKGGPLSSALSNAERRGRRGRVGGML